MTNNVAKLKQSRIGSFAFVISVCLCGLLSIVFFVLSSSNKEQSGYIELDDKLNPNNASVESLMRLPDIGFQRAEAIIEYRVGLLKRDSNGPVFRDIADLQKVKGIGPKTAKNMSEWLRFD
jgi:competence ComEA-like helix-hairpin-helix protein